MTPRHRVLAFAATLVCSAGGCSDLPAGLERFTGTFSFFGLDGSTRPGIAGHMTLQVEKDSTVTGTADIAMFRSRATPVVGRVSGDSIWLWIDPHPDGGVIFSGRATDFGLEGTWSFNTIAGPVGGGPFFAMRESRRFVMSP